MFGHISLSLVHSLCNRLTIVRGLSSGSMFAILRQARQQRVAAFTSLVSGPDDFPPGAGPYGDAVGEVQ